MRGSLLLLVASYIVNYIFIAVNLSVRRRFRLPMVLGSSCAITSEKCELSYVCNSHSPIRMHLPKPNSET